MYHLSYILHQTHTSSLKVVNYDSYSSTFLATQPESQEPRWRGNLFQNQKYYSTQKVDGCLLPKTKRTYFIT